MRFTVLIKQLLPNKINFTRSIQTSKLITHSKIKKAKDANEDINLIRNIGILAHIDAGKTTTTERMLFYSGFIQNMGEVHHGNTVTDFMEQERTRGITITSAAVTFWWGNHRFNLVDTPGHIDFTMEVEQTLQVLDGAVVVLDASAGVEAQTCTVWNQADKHKLPRLVYVNKMDRADADLTMCLLMLKTRLNVKPILLQLPMKHPGTKGLPGLIDLVNWEILEWNRSKSKNVKRSPMKDDMPLIKEALSARSKLVEQLADVDDTLAETVIGRESLQDVSAEELKAAIRRATMKRLTVPVLCGSSYHNAGVQPLMDAVSFYLPSPLDRPRSSLNDSFGESLCARVFKVRHDEHMGAVSFLRVYSGKIGKAQKLFNLRTQKAEQIGRLMVAYADDFEDVPEIGSGNIAAVSGLKLSSSGDLVTSGLSAAQTARKQLAKKSKITEEQADEMLGVGGTIPEPVFFCSIEPPSLAYQTALEKALLELQREDPSLRVNQDPETGQTVLAGMGELHLEVIKDRIISEYKINVELGPMQIAYKETLSNPVKDSFSFTQRIGSGTHSVNVTMSLEPEGSNTQPDLVLDRSADSAANLANLHPRQLLAIKRGVEAGMSHGPLLSCPVVGVLPTLHFIEIGRGTSDTVLVASLTQCVQKLMKQGGTRLLEPVVVLEVVTDTDYLSSVMADLSNRRANIQGINERKKQRVVIALTPLSELLGYSTHLRSFTSGTASFTMEFHSLQPMSPDNERQTIRDVTGFDPV